MDFIDNWANKTASGDGGGEYFQDGQGIVILKDIKYFKGFEDPNTLAFEFKVKSSSAKPGGNAPNAPGSDTKIIIKLGVTGAQERANAYIRSILGPDAPPERSPELAAAYRELLRVNPATGYTADGTTCPARGLEFRFDTYRKWNKKKTVEMVVPKLSAVPFEESQVLANREILDGVRSLSAA